METQLIKAPKPGTAFLNGGHLLKCVVKTCGDMYGLFYLPHNDITPFVTWFIGNNGACSVTRKYDGGFACHGHYARTLDEAMADLNRRTDEG